MMFGLANKFTRPLAMEQHENYNLDTFTTEESHLHSKIVPALELCKSSIVNHVSQFLVCSM
jgi:hypothetical protein